MGEMIFVGGTGRSGTSIVKEILAQHPDAASLPFEYRFIVDPDGLADFYASYNASWSPFLADERLRRLESLLTRLGHEPWLHRVAGRLLQWLNRDGKTLSPRSYHGWELRHHLPNYEGHVQQLMSRLVEFSFPACWVGTQSYQLFPFIQHAGPGSRDELARILGDFIRAVVRDLLEKTNKRFFVEDNTWNILLAREILDLIPDAKIIHVYRDPRDVVASFSHQRWSPRDKEQGAQWYKAMMAHWFSVRSNLPADSYFEIKLEELVATPTATLQAVCDFAAISLDHAMLETDLGHSHSGRWKTEFDDEEKTRVSAVLDDLITALGYEPICADSKRT
jgi:hypothetical protein